MSVEKYEEKLGDFLNGTLSKKEKIELDNHLRECESCRQALKDAQDADVAFRRVGEFPSPDLESKILGKIETISTPPLREPVAGVLGTPTPTMKWSVFSWIIGPAFAFGLMVIILGNFISLSQKKPVSGNTSLTLNSTETRSISPELRNDSSAQIYSTKGDSSEIGSLVKATGVWSSSKLSQPGSFSFEVDFQTGKDGRLTLRTGQTHDFQIPPNTSISVSSSGIELKSGGIWCESISPKKPGSFPLKIGNFTIETIGTKYGVMTKEKLFEINLFEGKVRVTHGEKIIGELKKMEHASVLFDTGEIRTREIVKKDFESWSYFIGQADFLPRNQGKSPPQQISTSPADATEGKTVPQKGAKDAIIIDNDRSFPSPFPASGQTYQPEPVTGPNDILDAHQPGRE